MKQKLFLLVLPLFLIVSCRKAEKNSAAVQQQETPVSDHVWYYLNTTGFHRVENVLHVPYAAERPWTEAVRISSASSAADNGSGTPPAYALVNRCGILAFTDDKCSLYPDAQLFSDRTAGNLVFQDNTPVFSLYKSTFFNISLSENASDPLHPFLAQFTPGPNISVPLVSIKNLGLGANSEITDYVWDGKCWICSVKTETVNKTSFSYFSWQPKVPLLSLTPATAAASLYITSSTKELYRSLKSPKPFAAAPDRLKTLLSLLPQTLAFQINCYSAGGHSPRPYIRQSKDDTAEPLSAEACIAETWICAVFQDGTVYLNGALYNKPVLNNGRTIAFKLPKLPAGFTYGNFAISGHTIYVAWEETSFYKTGKSGFISVDIEAILNNGV
jgi:hypothetical protein